MKSRYFAIFAILLVFATSCQKEAAPVLDIEGNVEEMSFGEQLSVQLLRLNTNNEWTAESSEDWLIVSPESGKAGKASIGVSASKNETYGERKAKVTLRSGGIEKVIAVIQSQNDAIFVDENTFEIGCEGGIVKVPVRTNVEYSCELIGSAGDWVELTSTKTKSLDTYYVTLNVKENDTYDERECKVKIKAGRIENIVTVLQSGRVIEVEDGKVTVWQETDNGRGAKFVILGDGFTEKQIADGTYFARMQMAVNAIFAKEPFTSLRKMCNVYSVDVVSENEGYGNGATALGGYFTGDRMTGGDDKTCIEYALKAVKDSDMDNTVIIVVMNSNKYAGSAYWYYPEVETGWSDGLSIAYFAMNGSEAEFTETLQHEAGGHGFGKLADEYSAAGAPGSEDESSFFPYFEYIGWYKNVDLKSDPAEVKWSRFISDNRYAAEGIGVYEGAVYNDRGYYRPTSTSLMRVLYSEYNAPSREAIYFRINKLYYGSDWEYDYETFVKQDLHNIRKLSFSLRTVSAPLDPPVIVGRTWSSLFETE